METSNKSTVHKGCGCNECKSGLHTKSGHYIAKKNQHKFRKMQKHLIKKFLSGEDVGFPINMSLPYTD